MNTIELLKLLSLSNRVVFFITNLTSVCGVTIFNDILKSDIKKMYRRIKTNPKQNFLQTIQSRENSQEPLQCIELKTVIYGTNIRSIYRNSFLKDIDLKNENQCPLAFDAILSECYMDEFLAECDEIVDFNDLCNQLNSLPNKLSAINTSGALIILHFLMKLGKKPIKNVILISKSIQIKFQYEHGTLMKILSA